MTLGLSTLGREPQVTEPRGPWGSLLALDMVSPVESLIVSIKDTSSPTESSTKLAQGYLYPISWSLGVILSIDGLSPTEIVGSLSFEMESPLAFTQGIVLTLDGLSPLEIGGGITFDTNDPLEWSGVPFLIGDVLRPATPIFVLIPQRPRGSN